MRWDSIAAEAAHEAGQLLLQKLGRVGVEQKGPADLVTEADRQSQRRIRQKLSAAFPDHAFLAEEEGADQRPMNDDRPIWIVDPLDGTTNFVHGFPAFCVSIALWYQERAEVAVVYDPVRDEMFRARRGHGASLNGRPLAVSKCQHLADALVAASFPARVAPDAPEVVRFLRVLAAAQAVRRVGSAALNLAYVAAGRLDAYWATSVHPWDVAAGALLLIEAGGLLTNLSGDRFEIWNPRLVATSTESLHTEICRCLDR